MNNNLTLESICNTKGELRRLLSRVEHISYNKGANTEVKDKLILRINKKISAICAIEKELLAKGKY
jgi:hypothetical protein